MIEKKYNFEIDYFERSDFKKEKFYGVSKSFILDFLNKIDCSCIVRIKWDFLGY